MGVIRPNETARKKYRQTYWCCASPSSSFNQESRSPISGRLDVSPQM